MFSFTKDIGMDLGTASVLIYIKDKGIVLNEPSVVALDKNTGKLLKVGADAQAMLGRTPGNIIAIRPLRVGVISDYEVTERMIKEFLHKVMGFQLFKPRIIICVPSGITEVEERAVIDAGIQAGARRVYLIEEPVAAASGAGTDDHDIGAVIPSYQIQALVVDNAQDPVPETDTADRQCQQEEIQYRIAAWHPVVCELTIDKLCNRRTGSGTYDIDQFVGAGISPDAAIQLPYHKKK